jgi:hypothetical protein
VMPVILNGIAPKNLSVMLGKANKLMEHVNVFGVLKEETVVK